MGALSVEVVYALPRQARAVTVRLPEGATVRDAVRAAGLPGVAAGKHRFGIYGEEVPADAPVADGDRVEVYRPLVLDPKEARRRRALRSKRSKP